MTLLSAFGLRRVLLCGRDGDMRRAMQAQLDALGARVRCEADILCAESLCHALHESRCACVIVPDLLCLHSDPQPRFSALNTLLFESREAGVPLTMLLSRAGAPWDAQSAPLFSHALGCGYGAMGDPVSVQCIRCSSDNLQRSCLEALELGARFLSGDSRCTGYFALPIQ